ncbi:MAG: DNA helicase II [Pseudomonadales bacterium]|nr:DNA helicase II [Pseudomonadales bacterium]
MAQKPGLLSGLNPAQQEAVIAEQPRLLVLAGAGSGKTRVLVHRIAHLLQEGARPHEILAVTFTNKAASEMRKRVEDLTGINTRPLWIGTFHGLSFRFLRHHHAAARLPEGFQIIDSDDQLRLVKQALKALQLDDKRWPPKQAQHYINKQKDEGLRPQHIAALSPVEETWLRIYRHYEEQCQRAGLVDFAELLLRSHELWLNSPDILRHYHQRFRHILVDEFQDTNTVQYAWLRMLCSPQSSLTLVGDDDQSVYGWRGAKVENIQLFHQQFENAQVVRLEQNYRSTSNILNAANAVIDKNTDRLGKTLWTDQGDGEPIQLFSGFNETEEARFIAANIQSKLSNGYAPDDFAMLYRSNAQSRALEEALVREQIPYRIYGGLRFFERAEIKNALAYLKLVTHRDDDSSFLRIINTPPRGIGAKTIETIVDTAHSHKLSLWQALNKLLSENALKGRASTTLSAFYKQLNQLDTDLSPLALGDKFERIIESSGLIQLYEKEGEVGQGRIENLRELVAACEQFEQVDEELDATAQFLDHVSLEMGERGSTKDGPAVHLMTMHASKGLEFPVVYLTGFEEGIFPGQRAREDQQLLQEERRLCYVGITRAEKELYITRADSRRLYGEEKRNPPSRFLREIPQNLTQNLQETISVSRPSIASSEYSTISFSDSLNSGNAGDSQAPFALGQMVLHPKFGEGAVLSYEGRGSNARVQVNFKHAGSKWLVLQYARLEAI